MRVRSIVSLALLLPSIVAAQGASTPAPALSSIRQADLRADLFFLGADAMRGRLTNTPENLVASEWIKARFERLGLKSPPQGFFQNYSLVTASLGEGNAMTVRQGGQGTTVAMAGNGFFPQRFAATAEAAGPVVFAGYGIRSKDPAHDDYRPAGIVKGAIVLVVDHEPGERDPESPFDGVVTSDAGGTLRKALAAQEAGAAGILFVSDVHNHPGGGATVGSPFPQQPPRLGSYSLMAWFEAVRIPAALISRSVADTLVASSGKTLEDLSRAADTPGGVQAVRLTGTEVTLKTAVVRTAIPDRNVLAIVEGSDPKLRDEWIVISAHFDHDGANNDQIFNGADDDGSGTVGLLEIAEAYALAAEQGRRPRRSVLFAAFNSEERGLLGAWAYTVRPTAPLDRIVAVLNMDMIGRNEEVPAPAAPAAGGRGGGGGRFNGLDPQTAESNANALNIIGSVRSPDLRAAVERANQAQGLEIRYRYDNNVSQLLRRSDHWPFIQNGVPGIWIFTGLHPDYHTVNDDPDRINYVKMEKILRLTYQMSWELANSEARPKLLPRGK
jgi:hypothetical protein